MDRKALIIGGGSGIGLAIAKLLAADGVKSTLVGRNEGRLEAAKKELPDGYAASYPADIT